MGASARWLRIAGRTTLVLLGVLLVAGVTAWLLMRGSLPQLDGDIGGLGIAASIERDAQGTPTITAATRHELAFATGFAHTQDRFFQMDLMRRAAAGELSALLGPQVIDTDQRLRIHGFRRVAQQVVAQMSSDDRQVLDAYVRGVNAALEHMSVRPWEYLVLRSKPQPWHIEDCILTAFSIYLSLNDSTGADELARAQLHDELPSQLFAFLHPLGSEWDAPVTGGTWRAPPIPGPEVFDLRHGVERTAALMAPASTALAEEGEIAGSNSWAVAGTHAANGHALLANDMHLGLRLPNVWYRARLIVTGTSQPRDLVGVTLPGLPVLVVGSNGHVAWGFTNSYGDWTDLVTIEVDPANSQRYLVGDSSEAFVLRTEVIDVRGGLAVTLEVKSTRWGPIVANDSQGRPLALAWTAHDPRASNVRMVDLELASNVPQALAVANRAGIPVQNFVVADREGHIGWTIMGQVPVRANYDSTLPASWRASGTGWVGWRSPEEYPRLIDPPAGRLWTANTRTVDAETWLAFLGDGGYDLGARAAQIRDNLLALSDATEADLARIQVDDRALFLARWRDLLLELLDDLAIENRAARNNARELVRKWSGRAAADDAGYAIVRAFRLQVRADVFDILTARARMKYPASEFAPSAQFEGALWQLVTQHPRHLLDPRYQTWEESLLASLDSALQVLRKACDELQRCSWGQRNLLDVRHPLSAALPFASHWLDMPAVPMAGDAAMPRVQGPRFGASERIVVAPGHEAEGLFQMPGGPVGHPLSPFYGAGHEAWVNGQPQPLLPGTPEHTLHLRP